MPIYEYECLKGHVTEVFHRSLKEEAPKQIICNSCHIIGITKMDSGFAIKRTAYPINTLTDSKSTKYFVNQKTGDIRQAVNDHEPNPIGYEAKEAKGLSGRLALEKQLQLKDRTRAEGQHYGKVLEKNILMKQYEDDYKANQNATHTHVIKDEETGKTVKEETFTLDQQTKDLMQKSIERNKKREPKFKPKDFIFSVNHNTKSSRGEKE